MEAIAEFKDFFARMKRLNLRPKVAALADVKLDFAEVDEDSDLKEATVDLKQKGKVALKRPAGQRIKQITQNAESTANNAR